MLRRVLMRAAAVSVAAVAAVSFLKGPASAGGGGGSGGGGFGGTQCGQSYTPSCTVTAGSPGSSGGAMTGTGMAKTSGTTPATGNIAPGGCSGTMNKTFGCIPPGCSIATQTLGQCRPVPAAGGRPAGGAGPPTQPAPIVLARTARQSLILPSPQIRSNPAQTDLQLTRLPTWLWISHAVWAARSKTASVPGESVTATAAPASVTWHPGDGSTVVCKGPGTPYNSASNPSSPSPTCGHTYTTSSAGQPHGQYRATATIEWVVTWHATGGAGGTLPPLHTTAAAGFEVAESQALDTGNGGQP